MIKIATRGGAIIINEKRIQRALKIKLHLSKLLKYFGSFLFISSYSWFCVFVCLVNELRACSCVFQCDVSTRARVCVCRLLDIPQGTPALSGDLMWLMSGLIITTPPHPTTPTHQPPPPPALLRPRLLFHRTRVDTSLSHFASCSSP